MTYYKFQSRLLRKKSGKPADIRPYLAAGLTIAGAVMFYFIVFNDRSGVVGKIAARILLNFFGRVAYIFALWLAYEGVSLWRSKNEKKWRMDFALSALEVALLCGLVKFVNVYFPAVPNYGGLLGKNVAEFFTRLFGPAVGGALNLTVFLYALSVIKDFSFKDIFHRVYDVAKRDIEEYRKVRALAKKLDDRRVASSSGSDEVGKARAKAVAPEAAQTATPPKAPVKPSAPARSQTPAPPPAQFPPAPPQYVNYKIPPLDILTPPKNSAEEEQHHAHLDRAKVLQQTLGDFGIKVEVGDIIPGPVVTRYDLNLEAGIKYQSITTLQDNLALALKAASIRIVPIPEKSAVGIEVPNPATRIVTIKEMAQADDFVKNPSPLTFALGQTTDGVPYVTDIIPMPHLLIAGATGSGKSVCIHSLIVSILLKARPDELKFILIDPKRLELPIYAGLPHLYDPSVTPDKVGIITDARKAMSTLKQLVYIMEKRYELFAKHTVRNIESFNELARSRSVEGMHPVHYIVVIIDELADLMLISRREIEDDIQRLAQMARAVGIHLVLATQRPSVDVITGVIKANFSARIAFQTTSKVDSRVILDAIGADELLGRGDMLFLPPGAPRPVRLQGTFVSTKDAENVAKYILAQGHKPSYEEYVRRDGAAASAAPVDREKEEKEKQYILSALRLVLERRRVSQDLLKAHFGSSAQATNVLSLLEKDGFIMKPEGTNRWTIHYDKIQEHLANEESTAKE
ncbi:MAG: cell division protein FtsK [Elusimicrobia bacterium HGW-Elusimicrobia-1]|jgi:S-DNA-T family DNA segregation ATPase FtsK/SpoIIIE|nr:MAG: cell division protein FtsK [Elusimicrobia bacterium HGW-Elusimicrobia-1]